LKDFGLGIQHLELKRAIMPQKLER
jgi:hypothetical protein